MPKSCSRTKNPCEICLKTVTTKTGIQCQGVCKKWAHYTCLNYTPGNILDLKSGLIKILCPCPTCTEQKETRPVSQGSKCKHVQCPLFEHISGKPKAKVARPIPPPDIKPPPLDCIPKPTPPPPCTSTPLPPPPCTKPSPVDYCRPKDMLKPPPLACIPKPPPPPPCMSKPPSPPLCLNPPSVDHCEPKASIEDLIQENEQCRNQPRQCPGPCREWNSPESSIASSCDFQMNKDQKFSSVLKVVTRMCSTVGMLSEQLKTMLEKITNSKGKQNAKQCGTCPKLVDKANL